MMQTTQYTQLTLRSLLLACLFMLFITTTSYADELEELREGHAKLLRQTEANWISWRYFNSRLLFYTTHIVTYRCGVDELYWGTSKDDLTLYPLGKPEGDPDSSDFKLAQYLYETYPSGCDPDNPYSVPSALPLYIHTDEVNEEESDSFVGLDEKSQIESVFIQINFADGEESGVKEFKIPNKILRQMKFEKIIICALN